MTLSEILSLDPRPEWIVKKSWSFCSGHHARLATNLSINLRLQRLTISGSWVTEGPYQPTVKDLTDTDWEVWAEQEGAT